MKTVNQNIKPITTTTNSKGNLEIGGCDLVELAKEYGTPLYVIDEESIRKVCKEYKLAFSKYQNTKLMYASKALCTTATSLIISQEGFGFDVVSAGEICTLKNAGVDMTNVIFNGNNKTYKEIQYAIECKVGKFSVDNFTELEMLDEIAKQMNVCVDILLRITPGIECHTHDYIKTGANNSKFGFDISMLSKVVTLILSKYKNINLKGLHAHIGSQIFETKVYYDEVNILVKNIADINKKFNIELSEIDVGGGLGVKYVAEDNPPSVYDIAEAIIDALTKSTKEYGLKNLKLIVEPGRSIVSTSGITLYTIGSYKQVPDGIKYISVDGGMADNTRFAMYNANYSGEIANKKDKKDSLQKVTIVGRFCETGDVLIKNIKLPNPQKGDILCIFNTGAYNYSMSSNYNRVEKPAMVLVNNSQSDIIIIRESIDNLISYDRIPKRWAK